MRLNRLARRAWSVTAATALMSGGLAAGALAVPASAAGALPTPTVSAVFPSQWDNRSTVHLEISGSNFNPTDADYNPSVLPTGHDTILLHPLFTGPEVADIAATAYSLDPTDGTSIFTDLDLSMAPAGPYRVLVKTPDGTTSAASSQPNFLVFGYGAARALSVTPGVSAVQPVVNKTVECIAKITVPGCGRGNQPLNITASNVAVGATVRFLTIDGSNDQGLSFVAGNPENGSNAVKTASHTGYPSSTLLQGNYTYANDQTPDVTPGFTPGWHDVQIVNSDNQDTGRTARFSQPWFSSKDLSVSSIGTGAGSHGTSPVTLTVTGQGIRPGSALSVQAITDSSCSNEVTTGPSVLGGLDTATGLYSTISAPVSVADCAADSSHIGNLKTVRFARITGPDGAVFTRPSAVQITPPPTLSPTSLPAALRTLGQGAHLGFDGDDCSSSAVTITGSNFQGVGETDPAKMVRFDFGPGIKVTTCRVGTPGSALISIDVAKDAVTGARELAAINPDGGVSSVAGAFLPIVNIADPTGNPVPLKINPGPHITTVTPPSLPTTTVTSQGISLSGTGFKNVSTSTAKPSVTIPEAPGTSGINIEPGSVNVPSDTQLTFSAYTGTPNPATPGLRDVVVEKADDHGRAVCVGCLGVNSLDVTKVNGVAPPTGATPQAANDNTQPDAVLTLHSTVPGQLSGVASAVPGGTVTLTHQVPIAGQDPIVAPASSLAQVDGSTITAAFPLQNVAPGTYNVRVVPPANASSDTWSCTGCFVVTGSPLTTTALTPTAIGQGALDVPFTLTGTGFSKGLQIAIPNATVHDVQFVDTTKITGLVDVADDAASGAQVVTVSDGVGAKTTNLKLTINVKPQPTSLTGAYGQGAGTDAATPGASTATVVIKGQPGTFQSGMAADLGEGVTAVLKGITHDTSNNCVAAQALPDPVKAAAQALVSCAPDTASFAVVVADSAPVGKRDATVTNPDHGSSVLSQAFTVNAGPKVLSIANADGQPYLVPNVAGDTTTKQIITVLGTGFSTVDPKTVLSLLQKVPGTPSTDPAVPATPDTYTADDKLTLGTVTVEDGKITAEVTVAPDAALGARRVQLANSGDKGLGTCDTCLTVADKPGAVPSMTVTSLAGGLKVDWTAPAANGAPVNGYKLEVLRAGSTTSTVVPLGNVTTYSVTGLSNGSSYTVSLAAVNGVGAGPVTKKTGIAGLPASLTLASSSPVTTYGSPVVLSGRLAAGSTGLESKSIVLSFTPAVGQAFTRVVTTAHQPKPASQLGTWSLRVTLPYTTKVQALWAGDSTYRTVSSSVLTETVRSRVLVTTPRDFTRTSARTLLKVAGTVSPNKAGIYAYLYRMAGSRAVYVTRVRIASNSSYVFAIKPAKGAYQYKVYVPTTGGNASSYSLPLTVYRT